MNACSCQHIILGSLRGIRMTLTVVIFDSNILRGTPAYLFKSITIS